MLKCTSCGSTLNAIGLVSLLDGQICEECIHKYYTVGVHSRLVPISYSRDELMNTLTKLDTRVSCNIARKIGEIQSKYCSRIVGFCVVNGVIEIRMIVKYRRREEKLQLLADTNTGKVIYRFINNINKAKNIKLNER